LYRLLRSLLFRLDAEAAHTLTLRALDTMHRLGLGARLAPAQSGPARKAMGLAFPNPLGLAAGFDKNGAHIDALADLGFGFLEVGTVTPRAQPGNPRPRLFRLVAAEAIINRMGFNNDGVDVLVRNVTRSRYTGILGINIGKNFATPVEAAAEDYLICLRKVYPLASYVVINVSSPNTANLRQLQESIQLSALLAALKSEQALLARVHGKYVPLVLKIAPDLKGDQLGEIARLALQYGVDGISATNTTVRRPQVASWPISAEPGGLSGAPLLSLSTQAVRELARVLQGKIPIIGLGGVNSGSGAVQMLEAGATLVQVYTGLVYRGPDLIEEIGAALRNAIGPDGASLA
jgi:dihydroorotate dehydrogenase